MSDISFAVSVADARKIREIAYRAAFRLHLDTRTTILDLKACHANGCPLDLDRLAAADDFNLAHDLYGINRHLNHDTGRLEGHFVPRFARGEEMVEAKNFIVWNAARNEAFVTTDHADAITAATGIHYGVHSALAMLFFEAYGDENLRVEIFANAREAPR